MPKHSVQRYAAVNGSTIQWDTLARSKKGAKTRAKYQRCLESNGWRVVPVTVTWESVE